MGKFLVPTTPVPQASVPQLSAHPNFNVPLPRPDEDIVAFTLRCAAHLVSPKKLDGEDEDTECTIVANALIGLAPLVRAQWARRKHSAE